MSKRVQLIRHDTAGASTFTGFIGEITIDTSKNALIVHDAVTAGGFEQARASLSNVSNATNLVAGKMSATHVTALEAATSGVATNVTDIATNTADLTALAVSISVDGAGNLGVGAPSFHSWGGSLDVLQVGDRSSLWNFGSTYLANNVYHDGTNYRYIDTGTAVLHILTAAGNHEIMVAVSGTAGNIITWSTPISVSNGGVVTISDINVTGGTDIPIAHGGTAASTATDARTNLGVDVAGTDNSIDVTLAGSPNYLTLVGQILTRALINLTSHITGILPIANGGTAASTASAAFAALKQNATTTVTGVSPRATQAEVDAGTDVDGHVTPETLANSPYINRDVFVNNANGNPNISDTVFSFSTGITVSSWESVGPSDTGTWDNTWTALNALPDDIDWIEVKCRIFCTSTTLGASATIQVFARNNGSSEAVNILENSIGLAYGIKEVSSYTMTTGIVGVYKIPVTSKAFDGQWLDISTTTRIIEIILTGYGYNS